MLQLEKVLLNMQARVTYSLNAFGFKSRTLLSGWLVHHTAILLFLHKVRGVKLMSNINWHKKYSVTSNTHSLKQASPINFLQLQLDWWWIWCSDCCTILFTERKCFFHWPARQLNEDTVCISIQDMSSGPPAILFSPPSTGKINCISKCSSTTFDDSISNKWYCTSPRECSWEVRKREMKIELVWTPWKLSRRKIR